MQCFILFPTAVDLKVWLLPYISMYSSECFLLNIYNYLSLWSDTGNALLNFTSLSHQLHAIVVLIAHMYFSRFVQDSCDMCTVSHLSGILRKVMGALLSTKYGSLHILCVCVYALLSDVILIGCKWEIKSSDSGAVEGHPSWYVILLWTCRWSVWT